MRFTIATFNLRNLAKPEVPIYADLMYNNDEYEEKINWTAQQLQKMNDLASKERARLAKLHQELLRTTKPCPHCSGRIPHGYTACMHCTRDVIWAGHFIGKPGEWNWHWGLEGGPGD